MPCKAERIRLGAPYREPPMRIQCWFTRRIKEQSPNGRDSSQSTDEPDGEHYSLDGARVS
jgi:hypothetical protein